MIDAASAVLTNPLLVEKFTIRRPTKAMQEGVAVVTNTEIKASGSVQPAPSKDLLGLPEGQREKGLIAIWTRTEIKCDPGAPDEVVLKNGEIYRMLRLQRWPDHFMAIGERILP